MPKIVLALLLFSGWAAVDLQPAAAQVHRPWCAQDMSARNGGTSCTFSSYEQCRMTATPGSGLFCTPNPWYQHSAGSGSGPAVRRGRARSR
jgi:hypothetical protein